MEISINTPLNLFNLKQGDIVMTSSKALLVFGLSVNDYRYGLVDLHTASIQDMLVRLENVDKINGEIIIKVINSKKSQLLLP